MVWTSAGFVPADRSPTTLGLDHSRELWLGRAAHLPGKALHLALALVWLSRLERTETIRLRPWALARFNVGWRALRVGLQRLEAGGLVSVERHPGRKPRVTVMLETKEGSR